MLQMSQTRQNTATPPAVAPRAGSWVLGELLHCNGETADEAPE